MDDTNIFYRTWLMHCRRVTLLLNIVVRITWKSNKLPYPFEFTIGINNTTTNNTKNPASERALILEGRQEFIYPYHRVLDNIIPIISRNVFCPCLDKPLYKLIAFI